MKKAIKELNNGNFTIMVGMPVLVNGCDGYATVVGFRNEFTVKVRFDTDVVAEEHFTDVFPVKIGELKKAIKERKADIRSLTKMVEKLKKYKCYYE
jgi:hypothetical protein